MKKILISLFLVSTFAVYALRQKNDLVPTPATSPQTIDTQTLNNPLPPTVVNQPASQYKDGRYTGNVADAYYGNLQVAATISGGKITDVQFLDYPHDRGTSIEINQQAMPLLRSEAIQAQSATVDGVTGATQTSRAFIESLQSALAQAKP